MRKLGILALTTASGIFCIGALIFYSVFWPKTLRRNAALIAFVVEEGAADYRSEHGAVPTGSGREVIALLLGANSSQKSYLRPEFRQFLSSDGDPLDSWKRPFRFDRPSDGGIKLRSAGPNGLFHDEDDVTSADLQTLN